MPKREEPLLINNFYHVFNKTIDSRAIFKNESYCKQFIKTFKYYRSSNAILSLSDLHKLPIDMRYRILLKTNVRRSFIVDTYAFCIMPTHFHFLFREKETGGILTCLSNTLNSFTRYFYMFNERKGPLFLPRFKYVRIKSREQFIHVSRYVHLNPYSSNVVDSPQELLKYRWSSFSEYLQNRDGICNKKMLLAEFNNNSQSYYKFVIGNANYQKTLEHIKHIEKFI